MIPFAFWNSCLIPRATCQAHFTAGCRNDGSYILLVSGARVNATCDMSTDGGGWTRLNSNLVTSSSPTFNASDQLAGNNVPNPSCSGTSNTFTVTGAKITYTEAKILLTRTTTIMQCTFVPQMTQGNIYYLNGGTWTSHASNCDWGNTPWAKADPDVTTTTLQNDWKLMFTGSATTFNFRSVCTYSGDNGAYTAQILVR